MRSLFANLPVLWLAATFSAFAGESNIPTRNLSLPIVASGSNAAARCLVPAGPLVPVTTLAFSPDGKTLAVGGSKEVLLWDLANATLLKRLSGPFSGPIRALAFHKDGALLAVGDGQPGRSGALRLIQVESGTVVAEYTGAKDVIGTVAFSPDGKQIAAGGFDAAVGVWEIAPWKQVTSLTGHQGPVSGVAFSADGAWLATASTDASVLLWDTQTWKKAARMPQPGPVYCATFGPNGDLLALALAGENERGIRLQAVDYPESPEPTPTATPTPTPPIPAMTGTASPAAVTPTPTPTPIPSPTATPAPKPPGRKKSNAPVRLLGTGSTPLMVLWDRQAMKLYAPCSDKTIKVFAPFGGLLTTLTGHDDWVYCAALSPDGSTLATGSGDGTVKLWTTSDGRLLATLVQTFPRTDQWLILTPQGPFATSSPAALQWKSADEKSADAPLPDAEAVRKALTHPGPAAPKPTAPGTGGTPKP